MIREWPRNIQSFCFSVKRRNIAFFNFKMKNQPILLQISLLLTDESHSMNENPRYTDLFNKIHAEREWTWTHVVHFCANTRRVIPSQIPFINLLSFAFHLFIRAHKLSSCVIAMILNDPYSVYRGHMPIFSTWFELKMKTAHGTNQIPNEKKSNLNTKSERVILRPLRLLFNFSCLRTL